MRNSHDGTLYLKNVFTYPELHEDTSPPALKRKIDRAIDDATKRFNREFPHLEPICHLIGEMATVPGPRVRKRLIERGLLPPDKNLNKTTIKDAIANSLQSIRDWVTRHPKRSQAEVAKGVDLSQSFITKVLRDSGYFVWEYSTDRKRGKPVRLWSIKGSTNGSPQQEVSPDRRRTGSKRRSKSVPKRSRIH